MNLADVLQQAASSETISEKSAIVENSFNNVESNDSRFTRNHQVKVNLVGNPRCPLMLSTKLILYLREHELKALAKSKNVSGAVSKAAKQQLERKGKL